LMNHRTMRSADVTQGYLHFGADELLEPASRIERAILENAGLVESKKSIDAQLLSVLESMSDEEKRKLIFSLIQNAEVSNK
ncbi:TPA: integrase, partial [Escherichia coli]